MYLLQVLEKDAEITSERSGFSGVTLAIILESKVTVDKLYQSIIEKGGESRDTFWGGYDSYFTDPDGNTWGIAWAPFWEFHEQGCLKMD